MISRSKQNIFLPFYHLITDGDPAHIEHIYKPRNIRQFKKDLSFLLAYFEPISASNLFLFVTKQKPLKRPVFHLSFDDGLKEIHTIVAPILKEMGIPATFFINPNFVGNADLFYRYKASILIKELQNTTASKRSFVYTFLENQGILGNSLTNKILNLSYHKAFLLDEMAKIIVFDFQDYAKKEKIYMSNAEILDLKKAGFTIGAHSLDHPWYKQLAEKEQIKQTMSSLDFVQKNFNQKLRLFAFPFSDEGVKNTFFSNTLSANKMDLSFGISGLKQDVHQRHLHRFPMEQTKQSARQLVKGEYLYYLLKRPFGKNKIHRD